MKKNKNILEWLQEWYQSYCDGDWEHGEGIIIGTIDNPGWRIIINLEGTDLERLHIDYKLYEESENNWYTIKVGNRKFEGHGDPTKLDFLLKKFREIVESQKKNLLK